MNDPAVIDGIASGVILIIIVPALVFAQPAADVPLMVSVTLVAVVVVGAVYTIGLPVEALNEPEEAVHV